MTHASSPTLALDLGTTTGWAAWTGSHIASGTWDLRPRRFDGGGMRFVRFASLLREAVEGLTIARVYYEEVRAHAGTDAAHIYGGFLATLTAWCEREQVAYQGVPVGTIKRFATGKGNAGKAEMIAAAKARGHDPVDDNHADALALLDWAIAQGGVA